MGGDNGHCVRTLSLDPPFSVIAGRPPGRQGALGTRRAGWLPVRRAPSAKRTVRVEARALRGRAGTWAASGLARPDGMHRPR